MLYQAEKGIYVYRVLDVSMKQRLSCNYYKNIEEFFYHNMYVSNLWWRRGTYDSTPDFGWDYGIDIYRKSKRTLAGSDYFCSTLNLVVCDEDAKIFAPEYLNDRYQEFHTQLVRRRVKSNETRRHNKRHGRKPGAFGGFRSIRTFQERKMSFAFDEENFVKCRSSRNNSNLPCSWDDYYSHNEKSWKHQSKRKHQWK